MVRQTPCKLNFKPQGRLAYKNIRDVMAAQKDLVMVLGEFMPKLVKMAPSGERPEN
jgi:tRNA-splicing ligase RtcB